MAGIIHYIKKSFSKHDDNEKLDKQKDVKISQPKKNSQISQSKNKEKQETKTRNDCIKGTKSQLLNFINNQNLNNYMCLLVINTYFNNIIYLLCDYEKTTISDIIKIMNNRITDFERIEKLNEQEKIKLYIKYLNSKITELEINPQCQIFDLKLLILKQDEIFPDQIKLYF